jgi:hypothetical protein
VTGQLAESVDIFPTLIELAGLPESKVSQPIDGVSLVPVLKDSSKRVRDHAFHAYPKGKLGRAIRTDRYRLVEWKKAGADPETAEIELYDYETDPLETKNLAADKPEVVSQLREILAGYPEAVSRSRSGASRPDSKKATPVAGDAIVLDPQIANRSVRVLVETKAADPEGVVIAQGGRENGYAIHFLNGKPVFDVRVKGKVFRLMGEDPVKGNVKVEGEFDEKKMILRLDGEVIAEGLSPGLIPNQPKDSVSVGFDSLSAAGDYTAPNPFNGVIRNTRIETGEGSGLRDSSPR